MYQLLNLINNGTCFSDIIYQFARYFKENIPFAVDFNIVLAIDIKNIY